MKTWMKAGAALCLAGMAAGASAQNTYSLPFVLAADSAGLTGFVRIVNGGAQAGSVQIHAIDDTGRRFGPVSLAIGAEAVVNFNSRDLEQGNASKGLPSGVGDGSGHWRLELSTALDIRPLAYIRTGDGFVTAMHDVAPVSGMDHSVPFFNPGSNARQVSRLRLVNPGTAAAQVTVTGHDDAGDAAPGTVRLTLPGGAARTLTAQQLEAGGAGFDGSLGDGAGKWRLSVRSNVEIQVMSLLASPTGHLANLSTAPMHAGMSITIPEEPEPEYVCPAEVEVGTVYVSRTNFGSFRSRILSGGRYLNLDDPTDSGTFTYRRTGRATATVTTSRPGVERCDYDVFTCTTMTTGTFRANCNEFGVGQYIFFGTWELQ